MYVEKLRRSKTFFQFKFVLETPVTLAELCSDARCCSETKFDGVELAAEGTVVLLIICIASRGKHFF